MHVEIKAGDPYAIGADLVAAAAGPHARELGAPERAVAEADPVAMVYAPAAPLAVVALEPDVDGLRTGAARAVRACRNGGTVVWALDASLPLPVEEQVRALAEGAVIGGYYARRWRGGERPRGVERFVICGPDDDLGPVADRAALIGRWTNAARELVDTPPNVLSPAGLAERAAAVPRLRTETIDPTEAGLGALAAVGASSPAEPLLLALRHEPPGAPDEPRLALVGKAVTFDTGGYFLKSQTDIVRQKADMAGGAAVVAALGAIAELGLPLSVTGVVPACENMLSGSAIRPTDVIATAAGLTVEVTNPDAEGRLILADALWWARRDGARYRPLIDSTVADLRNTAGKSFGFPLVAATFLQQFAGEGPWAHVDMLGTALLDDDRGDAFGRGATGYGVRMLVELATRLAGSEHP
jgi:leucyl aminopeptidase